MLLGALAMLGGCVMTPIDAARPPAPDWPSLDVRVQRTGADLHALCNLPRTPGGLLVGCAVVDFRSRTCTIFTRSDDAAVTDHERQHCLGYDHPGEATFRAGWERFKQQALSRPAAVSALASGTAAN